MNSFIRSLQQRLVYNDQSIRFATKMAGGSTTNGRDSIGKRLGVKKYGGHYVFPGNIIVRQRGQTYRAGSNCALGKDFTLYSLSEGWVHFNVDKRGKKVISVTDVNPHNPPFSRKNATEVVASSTSTSS